VPHAFNEIDLLLIKKILQREASQNLELAGTMVRMGIGRRIVDQCQRRRMTRVSKNQ
jgi:hypothetical protein